MYTGVYLPIVPVFVLGKESAATYALLDSGSNVSLCTDDFVDRLGLTSLRNIRKLTTLDERTIETTGTIPLILQSLDGKYELSVTMYSVKSINDFDQFIPKEKDICRYQHLKQINFNAAYGEKVTLIIGANIPEAVIGLEYVKGNPGQPIAMKTNFGWTLIG